MWPIICQGLRHIDTYKNNIYSTNIHRERFMYTYVVIVHGVPKSNIYAWSFVTVCDARARGTCGTCSMCTHAHMYYCIYAAAPHAGVYARVRTHLHRAPVEYVRPISTYIIICSSMSYCTYVLLRVSHWLIMRMSCTCTQTHAHTRACARTHT